MFFLKRFWFVPALFLVVGFTVLLLVSPAESRDIKLSITEALNRGDTATAINLLTKETVQDKAYHMNYYLLGMIHFEREQWPDAKVQFQVAQDKKSKHYESLYYLGLTQLKLGELDDALASMSKGRKKAKKMKAEFEDGYGQVLMVQGDYAAADAAFRQALIRDDNVAEYHIHLGDANFHQGIPSLAVMEYEKALAIDTAGKEVYFHWAEACLEMKDYVCAMDKLKEVLRKDSTYAHAWLRAGGIYFKAARSSQSRSERTELFKDVVGSYRKYFELTDKTPDSSSVRPYFELGMAYLNINAFEEAAEFFAQVLAIPYEPGDIYFYYGKALWGSRDYVKSGEQLLAHIEWVKQQDEETYIARIQDAELYQLLGDAFYYRKPNQFSTAVRHYAKSLEANPNQRRIVQNMAVAYHSMKSYQQALQYYDLRIEFGIDSASASLYKNAGYSALNIANHEGEGDEELEDEEEAEEETVEVDDRNYYEVACGYMLKYLEFKPDDAKILLMLGNTYLFQLADCTNGVKYFQQLLVVEPDNCDAKKSIGYAYFGGLCTKNYSKALDNLSQAYSCVKTAGDACSDIDLVLWIAQCYHLRAADKQKATQDAKPDFQKANEWYNKVLKCDAVNADAKEGIKATQFEF